MTRPAVPTVDHVTGGGHTHRRHPPLLAPSAGGTQHTVRFAFAARRRVLYPRLSEAERSVPENAGILALMEDGRAIPFDDKDIPRLVSELPDLRAALLRVSGGPSPA